MTDRRSEVAALLSHWAVNEMKFSPAQAQGRHIHSCTEDDMRVICRGSLLDMWEFVIKRIHSSQTVRKIKGNLALQARHQTSSAYKVVYKGNTKFSAEQAEHSRRYRELRAELDGVQSDINRLDKDLERLENEIVLSEDEYRRSQNEMTDLSVRRTLLAAYSAECTANTARYEEYMKRITGTIRHHHDLKSIPDQPLLFSKQDSSRQTAVSSPALESACTKSVRESCSQLESFLQHLVNGDLGDEAKIPAEKQDKLWTSVERVLSASPAGNILQSLAVLAEDTAIHLRHITSSIDLTQDAQQLRLKYSADGSLVDASSALPALMSVHNLIEEKQLAHMRSFMDAEQSKNNAWRLDKRLTLLVSQIQRRLSTSLADNPGALEMAKRVFSAELELAATAAGLEILRESCQDLQETAVQATLERDTLYSKYQKIQDFKMLTEKRQDLILVLVRQNSEAKKKLELLQRENLKYMQSKLCTHEAGTVAMTTKMRNGVAEEVKQFTQLPLHLLRLTSLDSGRCVPVNQLSINRFNSQTESEKGGANTDILQLLKYPSYKSPDYLLQHAIQLKCNVSAIELLLASQRLLQASMSGEQANNATPMERMAGITRDVCSHDEQLERRIVPVLQSRLTEASDCLADCIAVKDSLMAWWEQPGQQLTPWVTFDDLTLQQWLDKWTVAVTRLRQLGV